MRLLFKIILSMLLFSQGVAHAQSMDEIITFFDAALKSNSRGVCVGPTANCVPVSLDMLVNFDLDSAELTPEAQSKLDQFAWALQSERLLKSNFVVEGYTDASGGEMYNNLLSQRRALSVTAFLIAKGVSPSRLEALGHGEAAPRASDPFDAANRRVEMRIKLD